MDGDEEQRSAAVAVCDGATGDGAEQSGDAAPSTAEEEPEAAGSAVADPADLDAAEAVTAETDDAATDDVERGGDPTRLPAKAPTSRTTIPPSSTSVTTGDGATPDADVPRPCSSERSSSGPPRGDSARICDEASSLSSRSEWSPSP